MCGIIGIVGREPVAGHLVEALKRLEYRGYDSAGVATLEPGGVLTRRRAEGKLKNLEIKLAKLGPGPQLDNVRRELDALAVRQGWHRNIVG